MFWFKKKEVRVTADVILKQYRKLQRTPSGDSHAREYRILQQMVRQNQDQLYELIFSGKVEKTRELHELILLGGHGGSAEKKDNLHWIPFLKRIRERLTDLPPELGGHFDWLGEVHHYWDDPLLEPSDEVIELLDQVLLTDGEFDYKVAMERLLTLKNRGHIGVMGYMQLVDACNHRKEDGHYRDSMVYKRAVE